MNIKQTVVLVLLVSILGSLGLMSQLSLSRAKHFAFKHTPSPSTPNMNTTTPAVFQAKLALPVPPLDHLTNMHMRILAKHPDRACTNPAIDAYTIHFPSPQLSSPSNPAWIRRLSPRTLVWGMLFDCEEWMLEIKLNEIGHLIDHFIIVEGRYSLQNKPRAQCFPRISSTNQEIARWLPKIVYIYDVNPIPSFHYWEAEVYYRDQIGVQGLRSLSHIQPDDLMIISDVDELLTDRFLYSLKWFDGFPTLIEVKLLWSYYSFYWINPNLWTTRVIVSIKDLAMLAQNKTNAVRLNLLGGQDVWRPPEIVGWHCSWCMPTEQFLSKMENFAHSELNTKLYHDLEYLTSMRDQGLWFADQQPNACIQSRLQYPEYVRNHWHNFSQISVV